MPVLALCARAVSLSTGIQEVQRHTDIRTLFIKIERVSVWLMEAATLSPWELCCLLSRKLVSVLVPGVVPQAVFSILGSPWGRSDSFLHFRMKFLV